MYLDLSYSSSSFVRDINGFSSTAAIAIVYIACSAHSEKTVWSGVSLLLQHFQSVLQRSPIVASTQQFDRERAWADVTC